MVVGRLKRESNPLPGYQPGFLPQHERADGEFQATGENNPLPVGNYVQNDSGIWVPVSKQNPMPTQLTGRNVEKIKLFDALAITDTSIQESDFYDITRFKEIYLIARTSLNEPVELSPHINTSTLPLLVWENDSFVDKNWDITIQRFSGTNAPYLLNTKWGFIKDLRADTFGVRARCNNSPTSGSLSVTLYGVIN